MIIGCDKIAQLVLTDDFKKPERKRCHNHKANNKTTKQKRDYYKVDRESSLWSTRKRNRPTSTKKCLGNGSPI